MEMQQPVAFGTLVRRYRIAAGLTQEELAERASISRRGLGDMERGVAHRPRRDTVTLLAAALALSPPERAALEEAARSLGTPVASVPKSVAPSAPPFVGRARELALLERHLWGEGPPALVLAGEPGIGKTRLLHAAIPRAVAQGWCVLEGGCQRRGGHEPYAPVLGALQRYLGARAPAHLRTELAGCAWLVRLLPELAAGPVEPLPAWTLPPDQERRLMVDAVRRFLGNVAGPAGTLLVLDDLQWAGPDALDLLATLIRAAAEIPLRVIGAYRDTEVRSGDSLSILLGDLAHAGLTVHHALGPLTPAESEHLLAGLLADVADAESMLQRQVVQRAGGVPFFLVSYARGLRAGAGDAVPWDLAQGLRQRVAALPAGAQEALGVAAVIGRTVQRRLLAAVVGHPEEELLAALEAACAAQLVCEAGADDYQFLHDVVREVVEGDLGAARRALLHRRVAEALERQSGAPQAERLAYHFSQGAVWSKALEYLMQAGDRASVAYAHQDALALYAQALAACEQIGDAALPAMLAMAQKRGDIHMLTLHPHEASGDYDQMMAAACRLGDHHLEGVALAYRGFAKKEHHEFELAEATLRAALAIGEEGYNDVHLVAAWQLSLCLAVVGRKAEAEAVIREAGEWARQRGSSDLQLAYDAGTIFFSIWDGRFDDALATCARWNAASATGNAADPVVGWWQEALARGGKGEYERALALLQVVIATCERIGEVWTWRRSLNTVGWLYGELQDHRRALEWNTRGVEAVRERGAPESTPENENNARLNLADTLVALGRLEEAEAQFRMVEQLVRNPQPQDRYMLWRYAQHLFHSYGELWLARGDTVKALAYADDCLALAEPTTSRKNIVKGRRLRGQALLAQGRLDEAARELDAALRVARQVGNPAQLWKTLVARGDLRRAQGRVRDARAAYRDALAIVDGVAVALTDAALRETFLTSAHVQYIRQGAQGDPAEAEPPAAARDMGAGSRSATSGDHARPEGEPRPQRQEQAMAPAAPPGPGRVSRRERQVWVLAHLRTTAAISPRAYAGAMAVSVDTALIDLRELLAHGLVRAEGTTKDRRYLLRTDET